MPLHFRLASASGAVLLILPALAAAHHGHWPPTMREILDVHDAVLVVEVQSDRNQRLQAAYDLKVLQVIKSHPSLVNEKVLPKAFKIDLDSAFWPKKLIAFGQSDGDTWHWSYVSASDDAVSYLKGMVPLKNQRDALRHAFAFFESADNRVADDARAEWDSSKDAEVAAAATILSPEKVRAMVQDPLASAPNRCFAGYLLSFCGEKKDAELIRRLLEAKPDKQLPSLGYALRGYVLLDPDAGWKHLQTVAKRSEPTFLMTRLESLRTARFFHDERRGVISERDIERLLAAMLEHPDIADFVIEDLAQWKCWDYTEQVLALPKRKSHNLPVVRRAVLRYALRCPNEECRRYVEAEQRRDSDYVQDTREVLSIEMGDSKIPGKPR